MVLPSDRSYFRLILYIALCSLIFTIPCFWLADNTFVPIKKKFEFAKTDFKSFTFDLDNPQPLRANLNYRIDWEYDEGSSEYLEISLNGESLTKVFFNEFSVNKSVPLHIPQSRLKKGKNEVSLDLFESSYRAKNLQVNFYNYRGISPNFPVGYVVFDSYIRSRSQEAGTTGKVFQFAGTFVAVFVPSLLIAAILVWVQGFNLLPKIQISPAFLIVPIGVPWAFQMYSWFSPYQVLSPLFDLWTLAFLLWMVSVLIKILWDKETLNFLLKLKDRVFLKTLHLIETLDLSGKKLYFFLFLLLIIFYRFPFLLIEPRFWAEEGTVYFYYAKIHTWLNSLLFCPSVYGYFRLDVNLSTTLAAKLVPLKWAPTVTLYFSLIVMCIPLLIVIWGRSYIWDTPLKKVIVCLAILLIPVHTEEIWLNSLNSMTYFGLISLCILLEKLDSLTPFRTWAYRGLLSFGCLSGVYSIFLFFMFGYKALCEKIKEAWVHFGILFFFSCIQFSIFVVAYLGQPHSSERFNIKYWGMSVTGQFLHHIIEPILGTKFQDGLASYIDFVRLYKSKEYFASVLNTYGTVSLFIIGVVLYHLIKGPKRFSRNLVFGSFCFLSFLSTFSSLYGIPEGRYAYIPGFLIFILILEKIRDLNSNPDTSPIHALKKSTLVFLLAFSLGQGLYHFRHVKFNFYEKGMSWKQEVKSWREDPDHLLQIYPLDWTMVLPPKEFLANWKYYSSSFQTISLESDGGWKETEIAVPSLPNRFALKFFFESEFEGAYKVYFILVNENGEESKAIYSMVPYNAKRQSTYLLRLHQYYPAKEISPKKIRKIKFGFKPLGEEHGSLKIVGISLENFTYPAYEPLIKLGDK